MRSKSDAQALARKHLDRRLTPLRTTNELARPPKGWIKAIREALGMTTAQLAKRIGVSQSRITRIEKDEAGDVVTLKTLRAVAEGMNCTLVYALVPNTSLDDMLAERAQRVADRQLALTHHTMKLENQALDSRDLQSERERQFKVLMSGSASRLWDGP